MMIRLLNIHTLELTIFDDEQIPTYAIASHQWQQEEVSLQGVLEQTFHTLKGAAKLEGFCHFLRQSSTTLRAVLSTEIDWLWMDTCCIDQTNTAEVSEAINTMFTLYAEASICLAFLYDVDESQAVSSSRWFRRGWTLQELLAPPLVLFLDSTWQVRGYKLDAGSDPQNFSIAAHRSMQQNLGSSLVEEISTQTGIPIRVLTNLVTMDDSSCFDVFAWMQNRDTKRKEDKAYCLLGLFDISMPLIYGERDYARIRLMKGIREKLKDRISSSERHVQDKLSIDLRATIEDQLEALERTISFFYHERRTARLEHRTRYGKHVQKIVDPFNFLLTEFNELRQRESNEDLDIQKAMAFWNPLEFMRPQDREAAGLG